MQCHPSFISVFSRIFSMFFSSVYLLGFLVCFFPSTGDFGPFQQYYLKNPLKGMCSNEILLFINPIHNLEAKLPDQTVFFIPAAIFLAVQKSNAEIGRLSNRLSVCVLLFHFHKDYSAAAKKKCTTILSEYIDSLASTEGENVLIYQCY